MNVENVEKVLHYIGSGSAGRKRLKSTNASEVPLIEFIFTHAR